MRALEDQVAVVTGASSGIGKAIALALANQGAYLFLLGRNLETLQSVADAAKGKAPQSQCYQTDLAIESEVQEVVLNIKRDTKSVDILVHSADVIWLDAIENAPNPCANGYTFICGHRRGHGQKAKNDER
jgi:NADP-dependent 3-hydroxy acid dehydrogenase YdfG